MGNVGRRAARGKRLTRRARTPDCRAVLVPTAARRLTAFGLGAAALVGVVFLTRAPAPGLDDDAMSYLGAAMSLVHGHGLRVPTADWYDADTTSALGHFPPGFSLALAPPVALGMPPVQAARLIEAVSALVTVGGAAWLLFPESLGAALLVALLIAVTPDVALDHARVLSEPLFLALLVVTVVLAARRRGRPWEAGAAAAAAGLVRYAGFALAGALAVIEFLDPGAFRARARRAALAVVPTVVVDGAWLLLARHHGAAVRHIAWRGALGPAWGEAWGTLRAWLVPAPLAGPLGAALACLALAGLALLARAAARDAESDPGATRRLAIVAGVMGACYAAFLVAARAIADPWIPFDGRLLSPLFVLAALVAAAGASRGWRAWPAAGRTALVVGLAAWSAGSARLTIGVAADVSGDGWGYSGEDFLAGGTAGWLAAHADGRAVFTNNTAAAWFVTGRPARGLPQAGDDDATVAAFGDTLRVRRGVLVGFGSGDAALVPPDALARRLGLRLLARLGDGRVWDAPVPLVLAAPRSGP